MVCFDNVTGNRILDSLKSRAEWEKSYRVLYTQYLLVKDHARDLDSAGTTANAHCDSLVRNGFRRERELIDDNAALNRKVDEERASNKASRMENWAWRALAVISIVLAMSR